MKNNNIPINWERLKIKLKEVLIGKLRLTTDKEVEVVTDIICSDPNKWLTDLENRVRGVLWYIQELQREQQEFKESFSKWTSKSYNRTETNNRYFNLAFTGRSETEIDREVYSLAIKRLVDVAILMDDHYVAKVMLKRIEEREQDPKEQRRRKELFNEN